MDETLRTRIILAARAGMLTEEQYQIYLQLLEDEDFRREVEWEHFLDDTLPVAIDAELYAASDKRVFHEPKPVFQRYSYAIAASISLLLVAGALLLYFMKTEKAPVLVASRTMELYNGDNQHEGQLGYSQGDTPAGELVLKWWRAESQKERVSYRFCSDTLQLYFREPGDTIAFNTTFKLFYLTKSGNYFLETKDSRVQMENCSAVPKPILK